LLSTGEKGKLFPHLSIDERRVTYRGDKSAAKAYNKTMSSQQALLGRTGQKPRITSIFLYVARLRSNPAIVHFYGDCV
jgi:hypothetical protein